MPGTQNEVTLNYPDGSWFVSKLLYDLHPGYLNIRFILWLPILALYGKH